MTYTSPLARKPITTKIYGCGGFALNVLGRFEQTAKSDCLSHLQVNYVDTSGSNIPKNVTADSVYLFKNMDGGGKDRQMAYTSIVPLIPDVLEKLPPADFNIVVHSSSGGSGSSIGPALVSELLRAGKYVVVVQVGSVASKRELSNTLGTIRSYANISARAKRPVISYYRENNEKATRSEVDSQVQSALFMLALLFSAENEGLDTADLQNLLNYHNSTSFKPELSTFDFHCQTVDLPENLVAQAAAVLFSKGENTTDGHEGGTTLLEYRAEGFLSETRSAQLSERAPIYCVVYTGDFAARLVELESRTKRYETAARAHQSTQLSVALVESETDGMVF